MDFFFVNLGIEADTAKCKIYWANLPGPCEDEKCTNFCIQKKYQDGTCGFSGPQLDITCFCYNCVDKTSVQPQLGEPYRAWICKYDGHSTCERIVLLVGRIYLFQNKLVMINKEIHQS
jgi:hypothetical protein